MRISFFSVSNRNEWLVPSCAAFRGRYSAYGRPINANTSLRNQFASRRCKSRRLIGAEPRNSRLHWHARCAGNRSRLPRNTVSVLQHRGTTRQTSIRTCTRMPTTPCTPLFNFLLLYASIRLRFSHPFRSVRSVCKVISVVSLPIDYSDERSGIGSISLMFTLFRQFNPFGCLNSKRRILIGNYIE